MKFKNLKLAIFLGATLALFACVPDRSQMIKEADVEKDIAPEEITNTIGVDIDKAEISYCRFKYLTKHQATHLGDRLFGEEYTHGYLTMRSQDNKRAGMYCFMMLSGFSDIAKGCTIELSIDSSEKAKVKTYTFKVPQTESSFREVKLGITGSDWTDPKANINAWKVVIKAPDGKVIAEKRSWLWSIKEERETRIF